MTNFIKRFLLQDFILADFFFKRVFYGKNFTLRRVSLMKKDFNIREVVKSVIALFKFYLGIKILK